MKLVNKIVITVLTIMFVVSFYLSAFIFGGIVEKDIEMLIFGIVNLVINIFFFCMILKVLNKHYDDKNKENIKIYLYTMFAISLATNFYLPFIHNNKLLEFLLYVIQYYVLIKIYLYFFNRKFGYLVIKFNRTNKGIYIHKISSKANETKVLNSKNKEKDINLPIEKGDKIILEKDSIDILTFKIDE